MPRAFSRKNARFRAGTPVALSDRLEFREISRRPAGLFAPGCFFQAELFDSIPDLVPIQSKQRRSLGVIPSGAGQSLDDQIALDLFQADPFIWQVVGPGGGSTRHRD